MGTRRSWRRTIAFAAGGLVLLVAVLLVAAPWIVSGGRFGRVVGKVLPVTCGEIRVGGGSWSWGAVWAVLRGRAGAVVLTDVRVIDPEGTEVLRARQVSGEIEIQRKPVRVTVHHLRVEGATWRFAQMHAARGNGFLAAFGSAHLDGAGARRCGGGASKSTPSRGGEPPAFRIADAVLDGLDARFEFPDWALALDGVRAKGRLSLELRSADSARGPPFTFEVWDADAAGGGLLRVLGGAQRLELPFSRARIDRVSTTRETGDAIALVASGVTAGRSVLAIDGSFHRIYGPGASGITLDARIDRAADALQAVADRRGLGGNVQAGGAAAGVDLRFSGLFSRVRIDLDARALDVRYGSVDLRDAGFHFSYQPAAGRLRLSALDVASPGGGRLRAEVAIDRHSAAAALDLDGFDVGPLLPGFLRAVAGGTLDGTAQVRADLAAANVSLDAAALTLTRPPGASGPRVLTFRTARARPRAAGGPRGVALGFEGLRLERGTLYLPRITAAFAGGRVSAGGTIALRDVEHGRWIRPPVLDLSLAGDRLDLGPIIGIGLVDGLVSPRARVQGALDDLELSIALPPGAAIRILGQPFRLPERITLRRDGDSLSVAQIRLLGSDGSALEARGRVFPGERGARLDLALGVRDLAIARLPGIAEARLPVGGRVSGDVRVTGSGGHLAVEGALGLEGTSYRGQPLGPGSLEITPAPGGGIRGRGQIVAGVVADGTLVPRAGKAGEKAIDGALALELSRVRLDPFLPALPGGLAAGGTASGTAHVRVRVGEQPSADVQLSELTLTLAAPAARPLGPTRPTALALRAEGQVRIDVLDGGETLLVAPARLSGDAGAFDLAFEGRGTQSRGSLRGRVNLDPLDALGLSPPGGLRGAVDVDLRAQRTDAAQRPSVTGRIAVARTVSFAAPGLPLRVEIPSGAITVSGGAIDARALPIRIEGSTFTVDGGVRLAPTGPPRVEVAIDGRLDARVLQRLAPSDVRQATGAVAVRARVGGTLERPRLRARATLGRVDVALAAPRRDPIRIAGGQLEVDDRTLTLRAVDVGIGSKVHLVVGGAGDPAGSVTLDTLDPLQLARVDVPVRGSLRGAALSSLRIDDGRLALRLAGDARRRLRLSGEIELLAASVPASAADPSKGGLGSPDEAMARNPLLGRTDLDVRIWSRRGAVNVDVPHAPDLSVALDLRLQGTLAHPKTSVGIHAADVYSALMLFLNRLVN